MHEVDFLPVEANAGPSTKSGDAITMRFTRDYNGSVKVVVIDAGFTPVGDQVVQHVTQYYETGVIDLLISTHPDGDHLNGLRTVVERLDVRELLLHRPREHVGSASAFTNIENVDALVAAAQARGTKITEPFQGLSRFENQVVILGPTEQFYELKIRQHLEEQADTGTAVAKMLRKAMASSEADDPLWRPLSHYPEETLGEEGGTTARNETSTVTLVQADGRRLLFTGDVGLEGLHRAADYYEAMVGWFQQYPVHLFQVPHHGSRRNLSPSLLDRILGPTWQPYGAPVGVVSSAAADPKHPSPKVVNALGRRGAQVVATEGHIVCEPFGAFPRYGWSAMQPLPPLVEDFT